MKDHGNVVVVMVEEDNGTGQYERQWELMWRWWKRKDIGNLVVLIDERQWKCGGGGGGKTMEMWWRQWWRKDNGNLAVVEEKRQWKFGGFDR